MLNKKTVFALLMALSILFVSCAGVVENSNFETDGYLLHEGEKLIPQYIVKIGDNEISLAEYRYYYLNQKFELDGGDDSVWEDYPEYVDSLQEYVEDTLVEVYAIRSLAKESGVQPDYEQVRSEINEYKKGLSSTEFKKGLSEYHLTEELYEYILQGYQLYVSLFDHYFGQDGTEALTDERMLEYIENNYTHVKHILIYPNTTMSDEDYENHLNSVLEKARNGEDFDALVAEYSNDSAMPSYGYYFAEGEMPDEFVLACDALEAGEVSDLVKSSHGYHIIKKLDVDEADVPSLTDIVYNGIFSEIVNERIDSLEIEYAPEYEYITPYTLK